MNTHLGYRIDDSTSEPYKDRDKPALENTDSATSFRDKGDFFLHGRLDKTRNLIFAHVRYLVRNLKDHRAPRNPGCQSHYQSIPSPPAQLQSL